MKGTRKDAFLIDLHVHTEYSYDGFSTPSSLLKACRSKGISGVAITDHNTIEGALAFKKTLPITVIVGEEISTRSGHVIGLFLSEHVPPGLTVKETVARIRAQGGLVLIPHPFDRVRSSHIGEEELRGAAPGIDMVEAFNSYNLFGGANSMALEFARGAGKPLTAGSDAHIASEVGRACVEMDPFSSPEEFLHNLKGARLRCQRTPLYVRAFIKARKKLKRLDIL